MNDIERIESCIDTFNQKYPRPGIDPIEIKSAYDLELDWGKNSKYPTLGKAGVYFLLDGKNALLYVGESSDMGYRWASYINWSEDKTTYKIVDHRFPTLQRLLAIELPEGHEFERLAIEEYMIKVLTPSANKKGNR